MRSLRRRNLLLLLTLGAVLAIIVALVAKDNPALPGPTREFADTQFGNTPELPPLPAATTEQKEGEPTTPPHSDSEPPETAVKPDLVPVEVVIVDGDTGVLLPGAKVSIVGPNGKRIPMTADGVRHTGEHASATRGEKEILEFAVEPPPGYGVERAPTWKTIGPISALTNRISVTIVVRPEVRLWVTVIDADGMPVPGAVIREVVLQHVAPLPFRAGATGSDGSVLVHGVPALRGERVNVSAAAEGRRGTVTDILLTRAPSDVHATVRLPREVNETQRRNLRPFGNTAGTATPAWLPPPGTARFTATALLPDGSPAAGVRISIHGYPRKLKQCWQRFWQRMTYTDENGRAEFTDLPAGEAEARVRDGAFLTAKWQRIILTEGEMASATFRATTGGSVHVVVLDSEGTPLPYARLHVGKMNHLHYIHLKDGVQRLEMFTDRDGRAVITGLAGHKVRIRAHYGHRSATGTVRVGGVLNLTIK